MNFEIGENSSYGTFDSFTAAGIWVSFGSRGHRGNECMNFFWLNRQLISILLEFKIPESKLTAQCNGLTTGFQSLVQGSRGSKADKHTSRDYYILSRIKAPLLNLCGKSTFSKEDEIMINFERNW